MSSCVNHDQKWGYIHIPKTAGTTISNILSYTGNVEGLEHSHSAINKFPSNYFIFTFVRNPFTRYLSMFFHETKLGRFNGNMYEFTKHTNKNIVFNPQIYFIKTGETENKKVNFIGRYENLFNDINFVLEKTGNKKVSQIPHLNKNSIYEKHPNLNQQKYYEIYLRDNYIREYIKEKYIEDFQYFKYDMVIQ